MSDIAGLPDAAGNAALERSQALAYGLGVTGTPELAVGPSTADWSTYHLIGEHSGPATLSAINEQLGAV